MVAAENKTPLFLQSLQSMGEIQTIKHRDYDNNDTMLCLVSDKIRHSGMLETQR